MRIPLLFLASCVGGFAANPSVTLQVSSETAPAGSFAQFKVTAAAPVLMNNGTISMDFDATVFGAIANVAVFSATGDGMGYANVSAQHVDVHFTSPTSAFGQLPNEPVFVVSIPVLPGLAAGKTAAVTATASAFYEEPSGAQPFTVTVNAGTFTVGQNVAVQSVTPGGGLLAAGAVVQINGAGFDPSAAVSIDGVDISATQYVSPQQLNITLGAPTEMTGKRVHVTGSGGGAVDFYASLASVPGALPAGFTGLPGVLPLAPLAAYTAAIIGNNLISQAGITDYLALVNPNAAPVTVMLEGVSLGSPQVPVINQTLTVPADTTLFFNATGWIDARDEQSMWILASAPVRILEYVNQVNVFGPPGTNSYVDPASPQNGPVPPIETVVTGGPINWSWQSGTPQPSAVTLTTGGNLPFSVSVAGTAAPFLTVTPQQGTAPANVTVTPSLTSAAPGTYSATITFTPTLPAALASLTVQPTTVAVTILVSATDLIASSGSNCCSFAEPVMNMPATGPESLTITSNGAPASFGVTVGPCDGGNWLSISPSSGTTPATLTVTASPAGLNLPGGGTVYKCPFTIQGPSNAISLTAGLDVIGGTAAPPPSNAIQVTPSSVSFPVAASGTAPAPQTVTVQSNGNPVTAAVQTNSGGNWLSASVTPGTASSQLTISVSSTLAPGNYSGTVTVSSPGMVSASVSVNVTVTGLPPSQTPLVVMPSAVKVTGPAGMNVSPQSVSLSVSAPGGIPVAFTVSVSTSTGGNWLSLIAASSGVTPETLTLLIGTGLNPGVYSGSVSLTWGNGSLVVPVTYTVTTSLASPPTTSAIVNGGSFAPGSVAPGEIITLFGSGFSGVVTNTILTPSGTVPAALGGTQVLINGIAAPVLYASPWQVNAIVPYEVGPSPLANTGIANVVVEWNGAQSAAWGIPIVAASPAVFTLGADGVGPAALLNQDNSVNGASNPAVRGSVIQIYATGGGQVSPAASTGGVAKAQAQLALPVSVSVGGVNAQVMYAGAAPGEVDGVVQINAVVPTSVAPGAAVPLVVTIGGLASQAAVTVAVQ